MKNNAKLPTKSLEETLQQSNAMQKILCKFDLILVFCVVHKQKAKESIRSLGFLDFLPYPLDHLRKLGLALLTGVGVDSVHLALALGVGGAVASLEEMVVQLVDAAGAAATNLAFVWLELRSPHFLRRQIFHLGKRRFPRLVGFAGADACLDLRRSLELHRVGDMAVDIQCGRRRDVPNVRRERLDIHAVGQKSPQMQKATEIGDFSGFFFIYCDTECDPPFLFSKDIS